VSFLCTPRRSTIFELADGLKICDIKCKCGGFKSKSMVFNTSYKICFQNVETDSLKLFAKCRNPMRFQVKYKAKDRAVND